MSLAKVIGEAFFHSSLLSSIGSVEMSSKFSVLNFSKDQAILQRAAESLRSFVIVGTVWVMASALTLYSSYGLCGLWASLLANSIMFYWIVGSYNNAFVQAADENELSAPYVFDAKDWKIFNGAVCLFALIMFYLHCF